MDINDIEIVSSIPKKNSTKHLSKKWDKYLDDYNNYLKEYLKHYKKSLKGNLISLSKYPYMRARSLALYERLFDAMNKSILTEKQVKRIYKIQIRIIATCKMDK
jgi:hypothetical protein